MKINLQLYHWPALVIVWFLITITISYIVAVAEHNVHPLFPFLSELGAWKPSSNVFAQLMNIGALLIAILLYIRYQQIDSAIESTNCNLSRKWNERAFWLGFVIALGLSFVANFQGDVNGYDADFGMHLIGAFMIFGIGGLYIMIQTILTFRLRPYYQKYPQFGVSKFIQYFRLILTIIYFVQMSGILLFAAGMPRASNGYRVHGHLPGEEGYIFRAMSVISEWGLGLTIVIYGLSITKEFKAISFEGIYFK